MFGAILLTVVSLVAALLLIWGVAIALYVWGSSRRTGWTSFLVGLAVFLALLAGWSWLLSIAIERWIAVL